MSFKYCLEIKSALATGEHEENDGDGSEPAKENSKAARRAAILRDVNPSSTLEPSFEALNVKKFDLAFAVDPLFQRTSAQFDEGGARGESNLTTIRGPTLTLHIVPCKLTRHVLVSRLHAIHTHHIIQEITL